MPNTIRLHRVLRTTPEKVYRAFLEPDAMAKWLPPHGFTGKVHHIEARVGGTYKMSFTNFTTGQSHSFGGSFVELVPNEGIRYTDKFDDPNLPGEIQVTIRLKKVSVGTEVNIVQEGIPDVIPAEACYLGWQESLALLTQLVEPNISEPVLISHTVCFVPPPGWVGRGTASVPKCARTNMFDFAGGATPSLPNYHLSPNEAKNRI